MKNRFSSWLLRPLVMLMIVFSVNSCLKDVPDNQPNVIKVGVLLGFTGSGSQNAIDTKASLELAKSDINSYLTQTGYQGTVDLYFEDTRSDTTEAKIKTQLLIDKGIKLIIGPYTSAETKAVKNITDPRHVLVVSHSAVSTSLAIPNDYLLRFVPCDTYQAEAINAMFTADSIKAIIPVIRNDLWSNSLVTATDSVFTQNGGEILTRQSFEPGTIDFTSLIAAVKAEITAGTNLYGVDKVAIYLVSYGDGTSFLEALSDAGVTENIKIYGASAFAQSSTLTGSNKAAAYAITSNLQCPVFGFDEAATHIYEPLLDKIELITGTRASIYALAAYDILWNMVLTSITHDPKISPAEFKTAFIEMAANYFGATGSARLDGNGDRMNVYYDFWSVGIENSEYVWQLSAKYNTTDHLLTKI